MAELAVTDGMPPPADLPRGECIMTQLYDEHRQRAGIRIDRADPRILISAELLEMIGRGEGAPGISLEPHWTGGILKISGVNRTVIYRVTDYVPRVHGYIAEWPD